MYLVEFCVVHDCGRWTVLVVGLSYVLSSGQIIWRGADLEGLGTKYYSSRQARNVLSTVPKYNERHQKEYLGRYICTV